MKKVLTVILAVVALLGCNNEHTPNAPADLEAIGFGTVDTRADANLSTLKADGFGVWAYISNSAQQNYLLMENQLVEYDESKKKWFYSPVKYWLDDTEFSFIGAYPYDENSSYFTTDAENAAVKLTVSDTPSKVDFLIAESVTDTSDESYSKTVSLPFQHVLTSVCLNIWRDGGKHQNDYMRIKSVTLSNIRKGGVYTTKTDTWSLNKDKLSMEYVNETLNDSDNIGAATMKNGTLETGGTPASPFKTMMLLPQTVDNTNSVALKIEYQLKRQNAADWEYAELETVLPTGEWQPGKRYTYNVVLSSVTDITVYYIQTKVDQWGTPQVGGTVIIK